VFKKVYEKLVMESAARPQTLGRSLEPL